MKRLLILPVLLLTLLVENPASSADFQKGLDAYSKKDYKIAVKEFSALAEHGNADAQSYLGVMYRFGFGVIKDIVRAHMWWNISASQNAGIFSRGSGVFRDIIEKEMTPSQLETAQKLARECVRKNYKGC